MCECKCKCKCDPKPGEIRKASETMTFAIREDGNWLVVNVGEVCGYISHTHGLDEYIIDWPVIYRP